MILGVIFAGGQARRFGADKAAAQAGGTALLDRVAAALRPECDRVAVVGRDWPGLPRLDDLPAPGLGPLGALAGALSYADVSGFAHVLTSGCDLPDLPSALHRLLAPAPAVLAGQPLVGLWPASLAGSLIDHLAAGGDRSMRAWIRQASARQVETAPIANINTPADLAAYEATARLTPSADRRSSR